MADEHEPGNLVLVYLRRIDRTVASHTADLAEIRGRLGMADLQSRVWMLEQQYASLSRRLDRIGPAIDRILRRFDLKDETDEVSDG